MFMIGADPEMFLMKNEQLVAVQPYVKGTKEMPQPLPSGGNAQKDNVAIEFGMVPAASKADWLKNIGVTLKELQELLPEGVRLVALPSSHFPADQLEHPECKEFGCDPDYNAWTGAINEPPADAAENTFRSCGAHVHLSITDKRHDFLDTMDGKLMTIRIMDCTLGLVSTILDNSQESIERRKLYGKAGCFRSTPYGVEYRTLSNYWIKHPMLTELIYLLTKDVVDIMVDEKFIDVLKAAGKKRIQRIINEGDARTAEVILYKRVAKFLSRETMDLLAQVRQMEFDVDLITTWREAA